MKAIRLNVCLFTLVLFVYSCKTNKHGEVKIFINGKRAENKGNYSNIKPLNLKIDTIYDNNGKFIRSVESIEER